MPLSNLGEQISLNRLFAADQAPAVSGVQEDMGPVASPLVKYFIHLHSSGHTPVPSDTDMGAAYNSAGGTAYVAKEVVFTPKTEATGTASNIISLFSTVTFTTSAAADWAVIATYSIHACATAGAAATGNMLFYGTFATPATVGLGDTVQIVSGGTGLAIEAQ